MAKPKIHTARLNTINVPRQALEILRQHCTTHETTQGAVVREALAAYLPELRSSLRGSVQPTTQLS